MSAICPPNASDVIPPLSVVSKLTKLLLEDNTIFDGKTKDELLILASRARDDSNNVLAITLCWEALRMDPNSARASATLASALRHSGKSNEALDILNKCTNNNYVILTVKAACYCDLDNLIMARKCIDQAYAICARKVMPISKEIHAVYETLKTKGA